MGRRWNGWIPAAFFVLTNCGPARPRIEIGGYDFICQGQTYRIESVTPNFAEGYNLLLQKKEGNLLFKATDEEQDGVLDRVDIGEISLEEARAIYREGLIAGNKLGKVKRKTVARDYKTVLDGCSITIVTYILALGGIYNKLTIDDRFHRESIVIDEDSDGIIDGVEKGQDSLDNYQKLYDRVLDQGVKQGRIEKWEGKYLVVIR
jgi:hypothetical protein